MGLSFKLIASKVPSFQNSNNDRVILDPTVLEDNLNCLDKE